VYAKLVKFSIALIVFCKKIVTKSVNT